MNRLFLPSLVGLAFNAAAQAPIALTQATFPAAAGTVERYQSADAARSTLAATTTGPSQTWDYRSLVASSSGQYSVTNLPVPAPSAFAGAQWTRAQQSRIGGFYYTYTGYQALAATGRLALGRSLARQPLSLATITGGANDSVVINRQTVPYSSGGIVDFPLPLTAGNRVSRNFRFGTTGTLTAQAFGLNNAPFRIVQRYQYVDSVAGWGTLRVPVAGAAAGSSAFPVLQVRSRTVRQDSIFLNGSPAPALLLQALNLTQGAITATYYDQFWRNNSAQPLLELYYPSPSYGTPTAADYSAESTLLAARAAAPAPATLRVWPNPVGADQNIHLALATSPALTVAVRDAQGRLVAQGTAPAGQPVDLLRGLPAGIYLVETLTATGRATARVVVE